MISACVAGPGHAAARRLLPAAAARAGGVPALCLCDCCITRSSVFVSFDARAILFPMHCTPEGACAAADTRARRCQRRILARPHPMARPLLLLPAQGWQCSHCSLMGFQTGLGGPGRAGGAARGVRRPRAGEEWTACGGNAPPPTARAGQGPAAAGQPAFQTPCAHLGPPQRAMRCGLQWSAACPAVHRPPSSPGCRPGPPLNPLHSTTTPPCSGSLGLSLLGLLSAGFCLLPPWRSWPSPASC